MEIITNLIIGIIAGVIGGVISALIIYYYSERRMKIKAILEYADQTAEKANLIIEEARECYNGKDTQTIKQLFKKEVRRSFYGSIVGDSSISVNLQQSIAACNNGVHRIEEAIENGEDRSKLLSAIGDLNNSLLHIWNVTTEYNSAENKRIKRDKKFFVGITIIIFVISFGCLILIEVFKT